MNFAGFVSNVSEAQITKGIRLKRLKFGDAVRVYWRDSATTEGWQRTAPKNALGHIVSLGYVIENTPEYVTLSHSIEKSGPFLSTLSIPKGVIVQVEKLGTLTR